MTGLLTMAILVGLLGPLAVRYGADTRDGQDWHRHAGQWRPPHRPSLRAGGSGMAPSLAGQMAPSLAGQTAGQMVEAGPSRPRSVGGAA